MDYEQIVKLLAEIAARCKLSEDEELAINEASDIVREKPYTRTISQVQNIVDSVRTDYDVAIDYYDNELDQMDMYDCCVFPVY